ncbi:MAG: amidohydrolase [Clostridia bacterium]|nr:amidohydrolase [Clostridia bacterium]
MKAADTLIINGRFLTLDDENPNAEAIAISDGRIIFIGKENEARKFADNETKIIDLKGHVAAPAFIESHTHPLAYASMLTRLNLRGKNTESLENLLDCVRKKAETTPEGEWIVGTGYDEGKFIEGPSDVTRDDLDKVAPHHPVFLRRTCGHLCLLNSLAMKLGGLSDEDSLPYDNCQYFRDASGRLTGKFSSAATKKLKLPAIPIEQVEEAFPEVENIFFQNGITACADMSIAQGHFKLIQKLDRKKQLRLRIGIYQSSDIKQCVAGDIGRINSVSNLGLLTGFGSDNLWFLGLKYVTDGSAGGKTAAFSLPYVNEPENFGRLYQEQDDVNKSILMAAKAGVQASIHAIGDRAIETALTAVEYANQNGGDTTNLRFRLEHLEAPTEDHINRIKKLNMLVSLSGAFIYSLGDSHIQVMGADRLTHAFPAKTLLENGLTVACNSDCPVCDVNPMLGIYSMVTRKTSRGQSFGGKTEAIDRMDALKMYTKNAAYLLWREDDLGTLKEGKFADIIVFNEDFLNVCDEQLKDVHIGMTIKNGDIVYQNSTF